MSENHGWDSSLNPTGGHGSLEFSRTDGFEQWIGDPQISCKRFDITATGKKIAKKFDLSVFIVRNYRFEFE